MSNFFLTLLISLLLPVLLFAQIEVPSDCIDALDVSEESIFIYHHPFSGAGEFSEMDDASCFSNFSATESNSFWMKWTATVSAQQVFTIWPEFEEEDIDFVVYELPNNNCSEKQILRCMGSGDFNFPSPCMGATGLQYGETDLEERAGCMETGDNNFLAPISMIEGNTYALVINNFTSQEGGFSIAFCGKAGTPDIPEVCNVLTDVKELSTSQELQVYPNPTHNGHLIVELTEMTNEETRVELYDVLGRKLYVEKPSSYQKKLALDLSNYTNRIFFLKIRLNNRIFVQQIQKM